MKKSNNKVYVERLVQDMKVIVREMDNFKKERTYKKIIAKFEKGIAEEYERNRN